MTTKVGVLICKKRSHLWNWMLADDGLSLSHRNLNQLKVTLQSTNRWIECTNCDQASIFQITCLINWLINQHSCPMVLVIIITVSITIIINMNVPWSQSKSPSGKLIDQLFKGSLAAIGNKVPLMYVLAQFLDKSMQAQCKRRCYDAVCWLHSVPQPICFGCYEVLWMAVAVGRLICWTSPNSRSLYARAK